MVFLKKGSVPCRADLAWRKGLLERAEQSRRHRGACRDDDLSSGHHRVGMIWPSNFKFYYTRSDRAHDSIRTIIIRGAVRSDVVRSGGRSPSEPMRTPVARPPGRVPDVPASDHQKEDNNLHEEPGPAPAAALHPRRRFSSPAATGVGA